MALEWIRIDWRAYTFVPRCIIYISLFCRFLWPFQHFKFHIISIFLLVREAERLERLKSEINRYLLWVNRWKRHSLTQTKIIINGKYETVKKASNMKQDVKCLEKLTVRWLLQVSLYFGSFHPSTSHFFHWETPEISFTFFISL